MMVVSELAEAAARTGDTALVAAAHQRMSERARATPTDWALGIEARLRAMLGGEEAEAAYRESIQHLDRAGLRLELARGHLLYGEWLRRAGQRIKAREQLRTAHDMLSTMGVAAFAERARRELALVGDKAPRRNVETFKELTLQEFHIARLARDGLSNAEIGTRLFLSPRTVEWHLGKVFARLAAPRSGCASDNSGRLERGSAPSTSQRSVPSSCSAQAAASPSRIRPARPAARRRRHVSRAIGRRTRHEPDRPVTPSAVPNRAGVTVNRRR
jgi:hypothetical protein